MIILVTGDREWKDAKLIFNTIRDLHLSLRCPRKGITKVIQGGCKGADKLAKTAADNLGIPGRTYPAKWKQFGKGAGPIRNQEMLDKEHPDLVLAFHDNIKASKGTADMIRRANKAGVMVHLISHGIHDSFHVEINFKF